MSKVSDMREEYDFSKGERGKFYDAEVKLNLPVYLDAEVFDYFSEKAKQKGVEVSTIVNEMLKKDIDLIEGVN